MNLGDYMTAITTELGVDAVAVRFPDAATATGPAILWREADAGVRTALGLVPEPAPGVIVVEARSPTAEGSRNLAEDFVATLKRDGALLEILDTLDAADDGSQQRLRYFASVAIARIEPPAARH